jgi:hypothetical protein
VLSSWAGEGVEVEVASFGLWSSFEVEVEAVFGEIDKYRSPSSAQAK